MGLTAVLTLTACSSSSPSATRPTTTGPATTVGPAATAGPIPTTTSSPPVTTSALTSALTSAYQAETATLATYRNVVARLGSVGPFPNVITSEEQHVATVTGLLNRYTIAVPGAGQGQPSPGTLTTACGLGVAAEQQVISLYNDQLPKVSAYRDVTVAFQNLLAASRDNHLPAFQHCA